MSREKCRLQKVDALERHLAQNLTLSNLFKQIGLSGKMLARASNALCSTKPSSRLNAYGFVSKLCGFVSTPTNVSKVSRFCPDSVPILSRFCVDSVSDLISGLPVAACGHAYRLLRHPRDTEHDGEVISATL